MATAQAASCRPGRPATWRGESSGGAFESEAEASGLREVVAAEAAGLRRGPPEGRGRARGTGGPAGERRAAPLPREGDRGFRVEEAVARGFRTVKLFVFLRVAVRVNSCLF
jgi:hypothetical protein